MTEREKILAKHGLTEKDVEEYERQKERDRARAKLPNYKTDKEVYDEEVEDLFPKIKALKDRKKARKEAIEAAKRRERIDSYTKKK